VRDRYGLPFEILLAAHSTPPGRKGGARHD